MAIPANAKRIDHAFLDDIAHHAVPTGDRDGDPTTPATEKLDPDDDPGTGDDRIRTTYDDEMLDAHFIAGDSRVNENIGLSAVHQIFHSEHNRLVDYIEQLSPTRTSTSPSGSRPTAPAAGTASGSSRPRAS